MSCATSYVVGRLATTVYFPNGEIKCRYCKCCVNDPRNGQRRICAETFEIMYDIDLIGARCPLIFEDGELAPHEKEE